MESHPSRVSANTKGGPRMARREIYVWGRRIRRLRERGVPESAPAYKHAVYQIHFWTIYKDGLESSKRRSAYAVMGLTAEKL